MDVQKKALLFKSDAAVGDIHAVAVHVFIVAVRPITKSLATNYWVCNFSENIMHNKVFIAIFIAEL